MAITQNPHPRRPPAHSSVSLKQRRTSPLQDGNDSGNSKSTSPSSLQPFGERASSGESSSNADQWFNNKNKNGGNEMDFADNDPPFFMRNNSSSETPPGAQQQVDASMALDSRPERTNLIRMGTDGSSTEDYRGVIDDLTIENKKLKRKLKKYEKLHDAHLRDEKLFEVRFHGLPPDKKSELEETLQKFAASLGNNRFPANEHDPLMSASMHKNVSPAPNTDSAYASLSASGAGSSARSTGETRSGASSGQTARRENIISSYLHQIPQGLLPQTNPSNMTERTKQKLVVRRLEEIFAGKGAALHGHQQPQQQQEVSQMAAHADKVQTGQLGQTARQEAVREAHIMTEEGDQQVQSAEMNQGNVSPFSPSREKDNKSPDQVPAQGPEGEQRPTRPLDLDPHRAQVPAENLRYIRHLGFADQNSPSAAEEGQGWVYLNLLINMAQLHTINVTTEFVRKALATRSSKFEVSSDGRKVRWKGGSSATPGSSMAGGSSTSNIGTDTPQDQSPRKRPRLAHSESYRAQMSATENKLVYTPMFWNRSSTDGIDSTSEEDESMSPPAEAPTAGASSGFRSTGMHTAMARKRQRADGPIIFYQNAPFCTDLSGDLGAQYNRNAPLYSPTTELAIGEPRANSSEQAAEKRGPLAEAFELPLPMDLNDNPIPESMEISFPSPSDAAEPTESMQPFDLGVSGIGGIWPADNFALEVKSRHFKSNQGGPPPRPHRQYLSTRFATLWPDSASNSSTPVASKHVLASVKRDLPPSELPPALCFVSESDDYESDNEGNDTSESPVSDDGSVPSANPQPVQLHYFRSDEEEDDGYDDDMDDGESDGSVDMLATARELDPEAIRIREREYDANMAERLAEEIPAGSSAATAGGGSGHVSPAHGMSSEEYQRAVAEHRVRRAARRRSATADSMKVLVPGGRDSSMERQYGDEDEGEDEEQDEEMDDVAS